MGLKLTKIHEEGTIPVIDLEVGVLAVITEWSICRGHRGSIVQRVGDDLVHLGNARPWTRLFSTDRERYSGRECRARLLRDGETLEVFVD